MIEIPVRATKERRKQVLRGGFFGRWWFVGLMFLGAMPGYELFAGTDFANPTQVVWLDADRVGVWLEGQGTWIELNSKTGAVHAPDKEAHLPKLPAEIPSSGVLWGRGEKWDAVSPWFPEKGLELSRIELGKSARGFQGTAIAGERNGVWAGFDPAGLREGFVQFVTDGDGAGGTGLTIPGSSQIRGIAVVESGKSLVVTHLLPKFRLPSTQVAQGWIFTNAISWIELGEKPRVRTFPLDTKTKGFANPEGVVYDAERSRLYVAHGGGDVISVLNVKRMREILAEERKNPRPKVGINLNETPQIVKQRIAVGKNPRGVGLSPDGKLLAVANRLEDSVSIIDLETLTLMRTISVDGQKETDPARRGEQFFYSGKLSFSGQFSCASCHPEGGSDGLNWDLPADGFNNFHNTKSLLSAAGTEPYGWYGESPSLRERFEGTLRGLFQHVPTEEESDALEAYLKALKFPKVVQETANSEEIERGKAIFVGSGGCAVCHSGERMMDGLAHAIRGTGGREIDTPSLSRLQWSAPYLHDGKAETLEEIFSRENPSKLHGLADRLTDSEMKDLMCYLRSL